MSYSAKVRLTFEVDGVTHGLSHVGPHAFIFRPVVHFPRGTAGTLRIDIDERTQVRECVLTGDTDALGCAKYDVVANPVEEYLTSSDQIPASAAGGEGSG